MKSADHYIKRNPDCAFRVIDNQALIVKVLDGQGNKVFSLNRTGTVIWELANGRRSLSQIIGHMRKKFDIEDEVQLQADVDAFAEELIRRDLLQAKAAPF